MKKQDKDVYDFFEIKKERHENEGAKNKGVKTNVNAVLL